MINFRRGLSRLLERRAQPLNKKTTVTVTIVAALGLAVATVWAWQSSELVGLSWWPIILSALLAAPASLGLKSAEYQLCARLAAQRPTQSHSLKIAVLSSAANLLPLPGSMIVTVRSLSESGSTYGKAISASAVPGISWLAITWVVGGFAIVIEGHAWLGTLSVVAGLLVGLFACRLFTASETKEPKVPLAFAIIAVEVGWLGVSALRLSLAVAALGIAISPTQAVALSVAGALTVAIGFFPGGLGLREALLAALSPLIGLQFNIGVLLGSIDRLIWLSFLAVASAVLALFAWRSNQAFLSEGD